MRLPSPACCALYIFTSAFLFILSKSKPLGRSKNSLWNVTELPDDNVWHEFFLLSSDGDKETINGSSSEAYTIVAPTTHTNRTLPPKPTTEQIESQTLRQLEFIKSNYSRLFNNEVDDGISNNDLRIGRHLPRIVDKALRLLNLKQVVEEIETSVMSKVSCTACKADEPRSGTITLKPYLKVGDLSCTVAAWWVTCGTDTKRVRTVDFVLERAAQDIERAEWLKIAH